MRAILVAAGFGWALTTWPAVTWADPSQFRVATLIDPREERPLPRGITSADLARYRQIFALQRTGNWPEADRIIGAIDDEILLGHVLAARFLTSGTPHASFAELADWLEHYADHPQAPRIHKLALARKPAGAPEPPAPGTWSESGSRELWRSGVEAWRSGDVATAADRLTRLASDARLDEEERARAAVWAARANLRARRPQVVVPMLRAAATGSDEFYRPLAQRMLDDMVAFDRAEARWATRFVDLLVRHPAARRILALAAVGERELADGELRRMSVRVPSDLLHDLTAIARTLELPSATAWGAQPMKPVAARKRVRHLPMPEWRPADGYKLDPSLIRAVIRAESGFDPDARSAKGALGLMQIMPDTARYIAALTQVAYGGDDWLLDPPNNIAVGQAWLRELAATRTVHGSLIFLLAAYNAGEGRLQQWLAGELQTALDDPLLFVESIPLAETRAYIKKVMASLWAYQATSGEEIPSLRALAEDRWPEIGPAPETPPRPKAKAKVHARAS